MSTSYSLILVVAVSVLLSASSASASNIAWAVYNGTGCNSTAIASGTTGTSGGTVQGSGIYTSSCFPLSGIPGVQTAIVLCSTASSGASGGYYNGTLSTFSDSQCTTSVGVGNADQYGDCSQKTYLAGLTGGSYSITTLCNNGAADLRTFSLSLLTVLAAVVSLALLM